MFVCASFIILRKYAPPADWIPPLGDDNADSSLRAPSIVSSTPTWNPYSAVGIYPYQSPRITASLWDFPHSEATPIPLRGFLSLGGQEFAGTTDWTTLFRYTAGFSGQTKHVGNKDQHSEEA